mgnify:CR=1 FL=1
MDDLESPEARKTADTHRFSPEDDHRNLLTMFHVKDNLFFGRRLDGSVRVLKFALPPHEYPLADGENSAATFDITIDTGSWGSVVSSVSAKGEEDGRWYEAMDFHAGRPIVNGVTLTQQVVLSCQKCGGYVVPSNCHLNVAEVGGVEVVANAYCEKCWKELGK